MALDKLSDITVRNTKPDSKPLKLFDGGGLYLLITPAGGRWWRWDYRYAGKRNSLSMGTYPDTSLAQARIKHKEARSLLANGTDPATVRAVAKVTVTETFKALSEEWLERQKPSLATTTFKKAEWLLGLAYPSIGNTLIRQLKPLDVLACLRTIEIDGRHETAHRVKARIGQVCRYAVATGRADSDPTPSLRGSLNPVVSTPRAAITEPRQIGQLLRAIDGYTGLYSTRCALRLAPLIFVRPGELRHAEWSEFTLDGDEPLWRLPASKTKMRSQHLVPLSTQAVEVLRELHVLTGHLRYLFPSSWSPRGEKPMSENTVNTALRRLGFDSTTMSGHGFRALASTRLNEMGWSADVIERQLAHMERNKVRAVYNRAQYMTERRQMLQSWATYLDTLRADTGGKVVPIHREAA